MANSFGVGMAETVHERGIPLRELQSSRRRSSRSGNNEESTASNPELVTTEGGLWGWTVVAGSTTIFFVTLGLVYSFGVMQSELLRRHYASSSTLGWVSSTTVCFLPILGMPITALIRRTSNRFVSFIGALFVGAGYFATSFAFTRPVYVLFLTQSLFGIGYALVYWSSNSLSGQYFVRKRGLTTGIVYAGSGVGGAIFSIGLSQLIKKTSLEMAVRIYAIIAFATLIPASFSLRSNKEVPVAAFQLSFFRQINFNLLILATALITFSLFVPPFFLPSYAVAAGMTAETGAWLVAGYNLSSAIGRILFGFMADARVGPLTSLCIAMTLMAISILAIWTVSMGSLAPLILFLIVNGAASGALLSLQLPVLSSLYGIGQMASSMAMVTQSRAFGAALGPAIAGYLLDASSRGHSPTTREYILPLAVIGGISLVAAAALLALRWRIAGGFTFKKRV